ncbi:MAG: hypothetical protein LVQ95_00775 [Candidatus Micrarchaeales archaeon]|nr:hypothetical protein [Candidatus Micrarchaeales archaeon]
MAASMLIIGIIVVVVIVVGAAVVLSGGSKSATTTSTAAGSGGYTVTCTTDYQQGLASAGNLTCTGATLNNDVLSFQTTQNSGVDTAVSFYLSVPSGTMLGKQIQGFYINSTSPTNATWQPGQVLTVTFDLTPQQVSALVTSSQAGSSAILGWNWNNATSPGNGGTFASLTVAQG